MKQHTLYLGTTAILVQDEAFQHGYQQGQQRFQQKYAGQQLDDQAIHDFICNNIANTMAPGQENAGYITGWFAALLGRPRPEKKQPAPRPMRVREPTKPPQILELRDTGVKGMRKASPPIPAERAVILWSNTPIEITGGEVIVWGDDEAERERRTNG